MWVLIFQWVQNVLVPVHPKSVSDVLKPSYTPLAVVSRAHKDSTRINNWSTWMFHQKRALWSSAHEMLIGVTTDIRHRNDISIGIQTIISIVRVGKHFSKILVLSGVFNRRILVATNYANQDYMRINYTLIVVYTIHLHSNLQPIKKRLMFLPGYGPIAIADWSILVHCHLLVKHGS
jgi:hypothetical protein